MKIKKIKINSFGKLKNKEINFNKKINIIYGENEKGKSTLLKYIISIFYGLSKNKRGKEISEYEKYIPWDGGDFSGKIEYELNSGEQYEIYRSFHNREIRVYNDMKEEITNQYQIDKNSGVKFFEEQTKIDEEMFKNALVSLQGHVTIDSQVQNNLMQKIANLSDSGQDDISFNKVIDNLNKMQNEEIGTLRTKDRPYNKVLEKLEKAQIDLKTIEINENRLEEIRIEKEKIYEENNGETVVNNIIMETKRIEEKKSEVEKKNNFIKKIIDENKIKIKNLENEREKIIKDYEKNKNKKEIKKINKINYLIIFFILIIINIVQLIFLKNKIINYLLLFLIPIFLLIYFIKIKNNKKQTKINKKIENKKKNKLKNNINILNSKMELLKQNNKENKIKIEKSREEIEKIIEIERENIIKRYINKLSLNKINEILDIENLENKLIKNNNKINKNKIKIKELEIEEKNIKNKIDEKINLIEKIEKLKNIKCELEEKNKIYEETKELMKSAYEKMKKNITPKFVDNLSQAINKISNGKYKNISISTEKGIIVENENGKYIPVSLLSMGTIDELYLSLRISMIEESSNESMPIILDEAFAYFDDERLEKTLEYLINYSDKHQIILFTCTDREKKILDKKNTEYEMIKI